MIAYKLLRKKKDGLIYPLFIDKTTPTPIGVWLEAKCIPTKGFAVRQGYHCTFSPLAPHLKQDLASGEHRVWCQVEVEDWDTYERSESYGGDWILAQRMKIIKELTNEQVAELLKNKTN